MAQPASLTERQQRFVNAYLLDPNASKAAVAAGYSAKTARQIGSRLLANVHIASAVKTSATKAAERTGLTLEAHLDRLNELAERAAESEQFGPAVSAEVSRGKASGFYVDRSEMKHSGAIRVEIVREGKRRRSA